MTLPTIGVVAALGGFAVVYVACVTHPPEQDQGHETWPNQSRTAL